jgi:hypothetical protein
MNWDGLGSQMYQQRSRIAASTIKRFTGQTARWRKMCLERDQYKCVLCQSTTRLEVHHIIRWYDAPLLRLKKNNGVTLCHACHQTHHQSTGAEFPQAITELLLHYIQSKAKPHVYSKQSIYLIKKHLGITPPRF